LGISGHEAPQNAGKWAIGAPLRELVSVYPEHMKLNTKTPAGEGERIET
jgi:hypothetical protein